MASLNFRDCKTYVGGYNVSGQLNQAALEYAATMLDETTFGATTRTRKGGVVAVTAAVEGLWDASSTSAPDPVFFSGVGTSDVPVSMVPQGATVGNTAYLFRCAQGDYKPGATFGDLFRFSVGLLGSGGQPLVRGALLHAGSATGNIAGGTAVQLGAISATQYLYAALHVFSGTGAFTVKVQSDDNSGFTSATDRITFSTVLTGTAVASEWATRLSGAITDDYWRIVATNPNTRDFAVSIGIR